MNLTLPFWLEIAEGRYLTGLLIFARLGGMFFAAPLLSTRSVPLPVRVGLAVSIAFVLTPLFPPTVAPNLPLLLAALAKEVLLGLALGWTASLLFSCVQMAGEWLDVQAGFQMAQLYNPLFQTGVGPLGNLKYLCAGLVFLGIGGPGMLIRATAESFWASAPGALSLNLGAPGDWTGMVTRTLWIAIQIAAPVGVTLFLTEIALSIVNRALPQMNILLLSLPVKALLAATALAMSFPTLIQMLQGALSNMGGALNAAPWIAGR